MTTVTSTQLPSQLALAPDIEQKQTLGSIIASLSDIAPDKVSAFADKAFLALGKDGVKFLPFLTALVRAFQPPAGNTGTPGSAGAGNAGGAAKVDVGAATKALIELRSNNPGVKGLDAAIGKISAALPNLSASQFEGILSSLAAALGPANGVTGGAGGKAEIDGTELTLLQGQIDAAKASNAQAGQSATGNAALDAVLQAIGDIAAGGLEPGEAADLAQVFASLVAALMPPGKNGETLQALGDLLGQGAAVNQRNVSISIDIGSTSKLPGRSAPLLGGTTGGLEMMLAQGYVGSGSLGGGRGATFDGMAFLLQEMKQSASLSNFDPLSTNTVAYNYLLQALTDASQRSTVPRAANPTLNAATM